MIIIKIVENLGVKHLGLPRVSTKREKISWGQHHWNDFSKNFILKNKPLLKEYNALLM